MSLDHVAYPRREPEHTGEDVRLRNWARNATLGAGAVSAPATEAELQAVLAGGGGKVRMIGSRMSPGRLIQMADDGGVLLDPSHLTGLLSITDDTATFAGATPLDEVYTTLSIRGRMLPSSPGVIASQTLAGSLSTGTHGQGLQQSIIADSVLAIRMVLADGSTAEFRRDHPWFGAVQLGLGSLGVITQVTVRTVPSLVYTCRKDALPADTLDEDLRTWNLENDLVKAWWFPQEGQVQVWTANEATDDEAQRYRDAGSRLLEHGAVSQAMNETVDQTLRHLRDDTKANAPDNKPSQTVTRFRDFTDVTGDIYQVFCRGIATPQINVEIGVPLDLAGGLIKKIKDWHTETRPRMHYPVILRSTGPSSAWLSPSYGQDTCYFGFVVYYADDGSLSEEGESFLHAVEKVLAAEGGRPHWGKYFDESLYDWPALYPRWEAFRQVRESLDPHHRFANAFTAALFGDHQGTRPMKAWVSLLTQPNYLVGVRTLRASLHQSGSAYPLVVMVTDAIDEDSRQTLVDDGCLLRPVEPLRPGSDRENHYANARFAEVWTKLAVWQLTEFERVVCLDADMLVTQNMDELFSLELAPGNIAACHACRCNPNRIASYPASWAPENCFYTHCRGVEHTTAPGVVDNYLNGGLLVLEPDQAVFADMIRQLAEMDDLSRFPFAEQDYLNDYYRGRWLPLPYIYNALKTLPFQHHSLWNSAEVKNIHYIIDKPWEKPLDSGDRYYPVNKLWWDVAAASSTVVSR